MPNHEYVTPIVKPESAEDREQSASVGVDVLSREAHYTELIGIAAYNVSKTGTIDAPISIGPQDLQTLASFRIVRLEQDTGTGEMFWNITSLEHTVIEKVSIDEVLLEEAGIIDVSFAA